ncbi:50S ribosomal protein L33, partial [Patescibacteria group bacterium]|nr:50S ribosomal protein L33 [Patescibacteria group bacterium]
DSNLYANYAQAFRTPAIGQMFTYASSANPDLKPEEATSYEVGLRHRFDECFKANMSLYWMELDDEIWYDFATRKYQNYGKTSHKGIETGLDFKINKIMPQDNMMKLECKECKRINYFSRKNKKTLKDRLEMSKYCKHCKKHTLHKETK